jgi:hypothetical protein
MRTFSKEIIVQIREKRKIDLEEKWFDIMV